jgi:hypothetical protein
MGCIERREWFHVKKNSVIFIILNTGSTFSVGKSEFRSDFTQENQNSAPIYKAKSHYFVALAALFLYSK